MSSVFPGPRFLSLLQRNTKTLVQAKQIHAQLVINGCFRDNSLLGKLIGHYCSNQSTESSKLAHSLAFPRFSRPDKFLFNTLLKCSNPEDSIRIFTNWASKSSLLYLNERTFVFLLGACARSASSSSGVGRMVHGMVMKLGFLHNSELIGTTLLHFYAKHGDLRYARKVFDEMPERTSVTWNAMIGGYCSRKDKGNHNARKGMILFRRFSSCGDGVRPTDTTMVCVLSAISQMGLLEVGSLVHGYVEKLGFTPEVDVFIGTGLVDMYSKCGCLTSAISVFEVMRVKNVLTWTSMATGLALNGRGSETPSLLNRMAESGIRPNEVTFTSLLSAYRHIGLVQEGLELFRSMRTRFGVTPVIQHYGCIVDLLGKAGRLREAYEFVLAMPIKPDAIMLRSLCNACSIYGETVMGEEIGKALMEMEREEKGDECEDYVALSNVFASKGKWVEVEKLRNEMRERRIKTRPGYSFV
ncbi:Pentatricopeptide repeat-containing protein [Raphanus sativus]|uniref:Pentatricopeptide repeat-containing protein At3g18970 n=1 Tax=Raphanus sativus TaxID=3726 RepID=A0A6J0P4L6_RAPSA|nr:pentatricopeptide repeat-containing protein At3g18970 [Raphanus sativus]KAJ4893995.1 Pentatricopeptide repeat-containing protein [Raphanus sativus]